MPPSSNRARRARRAAVRRGKSDAAAERAAAVSGMELAAFDRLPRAEQAALATPLIRRVAAKASINYESVRMQLTRGGGLLVEAYLRGISLQEYANFAHLAEAAQDGPDAERLARLHASYHFAAQAEVQLRNAALVYFLPLAAWLLWLAYRLLVFVVSPAPAARDAAWLDLAGAPLTWTAWCIVAAGACLYLPLRREFDSSRRSARDIFQVQRK